MAKFFLTVIFSVALLSLVRAKKEFLLNASPRYVFDWEIIGDRITINAVAATLGYVGLGISELPSMSGADLVIGGVYPNGTTYSADYHGVPYQHAPVLDANQDWKVEHIFEDPISGTTSVSYSRLLDTGDKDDLVIKDEEIWVIWAIGVNDSFGRHSNHGSSRLNLFAP